MVVRGSCLLVFNNGGQKAHVICHNPTAKVYFWNRMFCSSYSFVIYAWKWKWMSVFPPFLSVCWPTALCLKDGRYHLAFNGYEWVSACGASVRVHVFILSHRLVLLPGSLEVHAAVFSALDDCPSTTGCFHVAIHLDWKETAREGGKTHVWRNFDSTRRPLYIFSGLRKCNLAMIPTFSVTLGGINKQWRVTWTIIWFKTLLLAFMNHLWECDLSVSSSNLISISLSLTNSPEMFPIRGPHFCRIKVDVQGVMWPLTLDLSVCTVITRGWRSICSVVLCFVEETPGWSGEGLSPQPAHTAEHTWTQPGYN